MNPAPVKLPNTQADPARAIRRRLALALGAIVFVAIVTYLDRDGFVDTQGNEIGLLESFYYSTVSVTTTGYGDIVPATDRARLLTTLLVTPARILFLIVLVGTTVELLVSRQRDELRISRWRKKLRGHTIICGFGVKGRAALESLLAQGADPKQIVAIDTDPRALESAETLGIASIAGDASRVEVLSQAAVGQADTVVVAPNRDDAAVLITLTARQANSGATVVASVREQENVPLLEQSGADSVIVSSAAAGRLLGVAALHPRTATVLEDLLEIGRGLDLAERLIEPAEAGPRSNLNETRPVIGVIRQGSLIALDDPAADRIQAGDRLILVERVGDPAAESGGAG